MTSRRAALSALLTPAERRTFARLNTPQKIQDFLDTIPVNFEIAGGTLMSPRRVLNTRMAHCAEAAIFAAAVMMFHGKQAWLLDIQARPSDQDHVVTLFRRHGLWGAISKTNHAILRWRDPIYSSVRELAMSYAHEYCLPSGRKSMLTFSRPFSLDRFQPEDWVTSEDNLYWLTDTLDDSPHLPLAPRHAMAARRRSDKIELRAQEVVEWSDPRKKKKNKKTKIPTRPSPRKRGPSPGVPD